MEGAPGESGPTLRFPIYLWHHAHNAWNITREAEQTVILLCADEMERTKKPSPDKTVQFCA